tara:strand:+ start:123 stop:428 length:306 start_codon:yes stop_codon:yes gene_type:complete
MSEIYEDGFGNEYIISEGEIKVGDMALNGDTGDVIYIDEEDDLFFRNETCQKLIEYVKPCETCGGEGEIWHSDYYCDMAYTTPCHECNDDSNFEYEISKDK